MKWNLIIDVAECENCNNCLLAAKDELVGNRFPGYSAPHPPHGAGVIRIDRHIRGSEHMVDAAYVPRMCNHCDDAPCIKAAPDGAVIKRPDGIVLFDPVRSKGRIDLVDACPYGAVIWNEIEQVPQTWFMDAHLLDQGSSAPRCVSVCPTRAIEAVKVEDSQMAARARQENLRVLRPELGTEPRVYYRHLERVDTLFVGGSVVAPVGSVRDCIEGAHAQLLRGDQVVGQVRTDAFGDFKFDALAAGLGDLTVRVHHPAHGTASTRLSLRDSSLYLGELSLAR